jgi:Fe-S cluster biosynthesis and repair protein YggX
MTGHWESTEGGKKSVGHNEIVVKAPGEWVQHMTIDVDGKRVTEMNVTHHRVK